MTDQDAGTPQVLHRWIGIVGLFVAPTTVITSVCVYFGLVSTRKFFGYFGIDASAIGFTTSDYVTKSISVLFAPILVLLIVWAALLWGAAYARRLAASDRHTRLIRDAGRVAVLVGALALLRGVVGVLLPRFAVVPIELVTPVALGSGTLLIVIGVWLVGITRTDSAPRASATAARASLFVAAAVMLMSLFWLTNVFATAYGRHDAESTVAKLWEKEEGVVVDTTDRLNLPATLIRETPLTPPGPTPPAGGEQPITYRYECFRSLAVRGDQWVLVPAKWTPQYGYAVLLTDDSTNRISTTVRKGIADTGAADWAASSGPRGWQCPEVAPASAYASAGTDGLRTGR